MYNAKAWDIADVKDVDPKLIMRYCDSAIHFYPNALSYGMRGACKLGTHDTIGALSDFRNAMELDSVSTDALPTFAMLVDYYQAINDIDKLMYYAEKANALKPNSVLYQDVGFKFYATKRYKHAIDFFILALANRTASNPPLIMYGVGKAYLELGDNENALHYIKQAKEMGHIEAITYLDSLNNIK